VLRRRLVGKLYVSFTLLTILVLAAVGWRAAVFFRESAVSQTRQVLEAQARWVEALIQGPLDAGDEAAVREVCGNLGPHFTARVTVILPDGRVIADSRTDPAAMENHGDRPEFLDALQGGTHLSQHYSHTLREGRLYLAIPRNHRGKTTAVIRTSISLEDFTKRSHAFYWKMGWTALALALAGGLVILLIVRSFSRPLEEIKAEADALAAGNLGRKLPVHDSEEIGGLAKSLNAIATQLDDRTRTLHRRQSEQEVILTSMLEGVMVVDREERLVNVNPSAARLFGIDLEACLGRSLQEVVRNSELQQLVSRVLGSRAPVQAELVLRGGEQERYMQASGTPLKDEQGQTAGMLVVFNDVTQLQRLENIRREFVANVSHELRTPITLIQGFVETLMDGALGHPEEARRFLGIIFDHSKRLDTIIHDLLSLSKIAQEVEQGGFETAEGQVAGVLQSAAALCQPAAEARRVRLEIDCADGLAVRMNARLLEQALVNLITNAIKYSEPDTQVRIEARRDGREIAIAVRDQGIGIAAEHLPRLFERFYRVDKSRSRDAGGSGLGLAIVKHVAQAHGGRVAVTSKPGQGSVFNIYLPLT